MLRTRYGIAGESRQVGVLVVSREGERWRRLLGEEKLIEMWNRGARPGWKARAVKMHGVTMQEQMQMLWDARVMLTVNGAQVMTPSRP